VSYRRHMGVTLSHGRLDPDEPRWGTDSAFSPFETYDSVALVKIWRLHRISRCQMRRSAVDEILPTLRWTVSSFRLTLRSSSFLRR
jgi:hypothetical protein